jgi:hypothetical protein
VLEVVFILLEPLSLSRRIFIGSHSLPPLCFAGSVLQAVLAGSNTRAAGHGGGREVGQSKKGVEGDRFPCSPRAEMV